MPKEEPRNEEKELNDLGDIVVGLLSLEYERPDLREEILQAIRPITNAPKPAERSITAHMDDLTRRIAAYKHRRYNDTYQAEIRALADAANN